MGAPRRKNLIRSRRRIEDEGEEEEGSVMAGVEDDSLSEGSAISDADEDADAEGSETSDMEMNARRSQASKTETNGHTEMVNGAVGRFAATRKIATPAAPMTDTEAMMNGLNMSGNLQTTEEVDFEDMVEQQDNQGTSLQSEAAMARSETLADRRRREHEEYRKKRDADPAFVPNRGGFFMHDHRSAAPGQNGFRPFGRGRGRGRGGNNGPFPSNIQAVQSSNPADAPWAHDLHETISHPEPSAVETTNAAQSLSGSNLSKPGQFPRAPPPNRSFSKTTRIGNVQIRVYLDGMTDPIVFSAVPFNQHTRLPHHRPPLRRDKPVRISLPDIPPRYIFPAIDRSFIFIPRALRPNQQGFGRGRGKGGFNSYGGFSSRRTSAHGGSIYSPSIAMSRRSSMAKERVISPSGSSFSRALGAESGKPVVRLPPSAEGTPQNVLGPSNAPVVNLPQPQSYPLPQNPAFRENRPVPIPMHQPRPQKTVHVADIESPASFTFNPPQQQTQQPFHQQVPAQVNGQPYAPDQSLYLQSRHPSHPSQASGGTPLSQIPERAIHAQPFQPYPYQPPQGFYPHQYPTPIYFYPTPNPASALGPSVAAPTFVPGQQYPYAISGTSAPPPPLQSQSQAADPSNPAGTVAHESNGMVYYYDSSQLAAGPEATATYPPTGYAQAQPGPPIGMGELQGGYYYPQPTAPVYFAPQ